jgi:hypothetical protein
VCGLGAGEGVRAGVLVPGVPRAFSLAAGLVLAAPGCGAALPSAGSDPFLKSGVRSRRAPWW